MNHTSALKNTQPLKGYIISILLVIAFSYLFIVLANGDTVIIWGRENGIFECLTSLCYFIAFILLVLTFKKNKNIFLLLLALALFFGAGEEIDWGQWIFKFPTPGFINKVNVQHEFNIHNMIAFNEVNMQQVPKHGLQRLMEIDFQLKIFCIIFGIIWPFCVSNFKFVASFARKLKVPVPPISIGIFFLVSWLGFKLACYLVPHEADMSLKSHYQKILNAAEEIYEFVGSYILYMISLYFYRNRKKDIMGKPYQKEMG